MGRLSGNWYVSVGVCKITTNGLRIDDEHSVLTLTTDGRIDGGNDIVKTFYIR